MSNPRTKHHSSHSNIMISPDPVQQGPVPDTAEKLANYTGTVTWDYLKPHYERGGLFFVDPCIKLEIVGEAIANNCSDKVAAWLKSADLVKITELHASQWEEKPDLLFDALVVSPFVLFRPA